MRGRAWGDRAPPLPPPGLEGTCPRFSQPPFKSGSSHSFHLCTPQPTVPLVFGLDLLPSLLTLTASKGQQKRFFQRKVRPLPSTLLGPPTAPSLPGETQSPPQLPAFPSCPVPQSLFAMPASGPLHIVPSPSQLLLLESPIRGELPTPQADPSNASLGSSPSPVSLHQALLWPHKPGGTLSPVPTATNLHNVEVEVSQVPVLCKHSLGRGLPKPWSSKRGDPA